MLRHRPSTRREEYRRVGFVFYNTTAISGCEANSKYRAHALGSSVAIQESWVLMSTIMRRPSRADAGLGVLLVALLDGRFVDAVGAGRVINVCGHVVVR